MLISERLWKRSFGGNPSIIGRDVRLDGTPRTIVGVMPAGFRFPSQTDLWVPMASVFGMNDDRSWRADQAIGRLKPGATAQQAQAEMALIAERLALQYPDTNKEIGAAVVPLRDHFAGDVRFSLLLLLASCGGVLLIACANVSQLLLARATTRERELSVRAALGASRWRLARQVLTESALLALVGSAAGVVLAFWLVDVVATSIPIELPFWITIDLNASVLIFTVVVSCITALLAGSLPAWQAARVGISQSLKSAGGNMGGTGAGARWREILTVAQVAVSIVLLVGASLVLRSMLKLKEVNPGFDARNVLMMEVNPDLQQRRTGPGAGRPVLALAPSASARCREWKRSVRTTVRRLCHNGPGTARSSRPSINRPTSKAAIRARTFRPLAPTIFEPSGSHFGTAEFSTSATNWMRHAFA